MNMQMYKTHCVPPFLVPIIAEKKASENRGEKRIVIIVTLFALCYAVDEIS